MSRRESTLREATGLHEARPHDLRHAFATRAIEAGRIGETIAIDSSYVKALRRFASRYNKPAINFPSAIYLF